MIYGQGFFAQMNELEDGLLNGSITKVGNTYFKGKEKLGVGKLKAAQTLKDLLTSVS